MKANEKLALKPCPFCGHEAEIVTPQSNHHTCWIRCAACGAKVAANYSSRISDAVNAWNKRCACCAKKEVA